MDNLSFNKCSGEFVETTIQGEKILHPSQKASRKLISCKRNNYEIKDLSGNECIVCNKQCSSVYNLRQHEKIHNKGVRRSYFCFIRDCQKYFFYICSLKKHITKVHPDELTALNDNEQKLNFLSLYRKVEKKEIVLDFLNPKNQLNKYFPKKERDLEANKAEANKIDDIEMIKSDNTKGERDSKQESNNIIKMIVEGSMKRNNQINKLNSVSFNYCSSLIANLSKLISLQQSVASINNTELVKALEEIKNNIEDANRFSKDVINKYF